jgi:hypothetical protein
VVFGAWPLASSAIGVQGNPTTGKIYDVSGRNNHGTTTGLTLVHTPFGYGIDFGPNDTEKITIESAGGSGTIGVAKTQNFTWMVLIKFGNVFENQIIFQHGDSSTDATGWQLSMRSDGKLQYKNNEPLGHTLVGDTALSADVWYRLGISIGSGDDPQIAIYVDGVEDGFRAAGSDTNQGFEPNVDFIIGKQSRSISEGLTDAVIADITLYDSFFSEPQAGTDSNKLFETYYENLPLAFDGLEEIGGGILAGGSALVSDTGSIVVGGGALIGGKAPEEPPISGGVVLGGHVAGESFYDGSGGILLGGVALEAWEFDSQGGIKAGGLATVNAIYTPKFPTSNTSEEFVAGTGANLGPFNDWSSAEQVTLGTDGFAFANLEDSPTAKSSLLIATNFQLGIPTGIVPLGIKVFINCKTDNSTRGVFSRIFLTKDGSNSVGDEKADNSEIGTTQHEETYGGASDLWGTTFTAAELNDPNFGFAIEVLSDPGSGTVQANIYQMRVQVTAVDINVDTIATIGGQGLSPQTFNETVSGGVVAGGVAFHSEGEVEEAGGGILVGGIVPELMAFDPFIVGGLLAGGEGLEEIGNLADGGALLGGHAFTVDNEVGVGGILLGGAGEVTFHIVKGGAFAGGAAVVGIQPPVSGGVILGGKSITGFAEFGGVLLGGSTDEFFAYNPVLSGGSLVGGLAETISAEAFIPAGGMLVGGTAEPMVVYNPTAVGGALLNGKAPEEPPISGGVLLGGASLSFVDQQAKGGILVGGEGIEEIALLGFGGALLGGEAIAQEIQEEPITGGMLVGGSAIVEITPFHEGGMLAGGIATVSSIYSSNISIGGALVGGLNVGEIQPSVSGGIILGGEAFEFITELGTGGALVGGFGSQTYFESGVGGAILGGESESSIDYTGQGGAIIGGLALVSDEIIKHPSGGALVGGSALRSTSIIEHPAGGAQVSAFTLLHYNFIGGVNFDDTVSYGGPVTIGGSATVVRPTIKFIGNGPVVVSGSAEASFAFSDYSFEGQTPVPTPVVIQGTASVVLVINDQTCFTPDKPCRIIDKQTSKRRIHCTQPELFASYCGDLRKGNQCSTDTALLPAIIACRQRLLVQQDVLDIKNKTVLRNRGNVI